MYYSVRIQRETYKGYKCIFQQGYKWKTRKIQGKVIKDTRERHKGYKGKAGSIQGKDVKDTTERHA